MVEPRVSNRQETWDGLDVSGKGSCLCGFAWGAGHRAVSAGLRFFAVSLHLGN